MERPDFLKTLVMGFVVAVYLLGGQIAINVWIARKVEGSDLFFKSILEAIMVTLDLGLPQDREKSSELKLPFSRALVRNLISAIIKQK